MRALVVSVLVALVTLGGCSDPSLAVRFRITPGDNAACFDASGKKVTACEDVTMSCDVVVSIRIFAPSDPSSPVISVCKPPIGKRDLCSISSIDLPQPEQPVSAQTLEVEILVYQARQLQKVDDVYQCPANVAFDAQGFPIASVVPCVGDTECEPTPAVGGVAFYHPGDAETVVDLGCTDLTQLNDSSCTGASTTVTAAVTDFDTQVTVASSTADRLTVSVGEPQPVTVGVDTHYQLLQSLGEVVLPRSPGTQVPTWTGTAGSVLSPACLEVSEDVAQSTASVRCIPNTLAKSMLDMTGTRLQRATLDSILTALGTPGHFPDNGLVVGVVLDFLGNPMPGVEVTTDCGGCDAGPIKYLDALRTGVTTTATSSNGIFISEKAPFGTLFDAVTTNPITPQLGGLIDNKVTIVILQAGMQTGS
ncbi:MAG: hypothetical protein ABI678_02670 [Kofleriaceae bacterium]